MMMRREGRRKGGRARGIRTGLSLHPDGDEIDLQALALELGEAPLRLLDHLGIVPSAQTPARGREGGREGAVRGGQWKEM